MKDFLLLFRGGDMQSMQSPELMQQHMMKWKTWMDGIAKDGCLLGGDPLTAGGTVLKGAQKQVIDGPYAEGKEIVGGYLKIKADDRQGAIEIAKGCPIFEHEGTVEVREVQAM